MVENRDGGEAEAKCYVPNCFAFAFRTDTNQICFQNRLLVLLVKSELWYGTITASMMPITTLFIF